MERSTCELCISDDDYLCELCSYCSSEEKIEDVKEKSEKHLTNEN